MNTFLKTIQAFTNIKCLPLLIEINYTDSNSIKKTQRGFSGVRVAHSCVLSVVLVNHCLCFCSRSFGHSVSFFDSRLL